jgi:hypothetical protein
MDPGSADLRISAKNKYLRILTKEVSKEIDSFFVSANMGLRRMLT